MRKWTWIGLIVFILILSFGCMQTESSGRNKTLRENTTDQNDDNNKPGSGFLVDYNYIQFGGKNFTSTFNLESDFKDSFYIRGKEVDIQIQKNSLSTIDCLVIHFPDITPSEGASVLIIAAVPKNFYSLSAQSMERYYFLSPSEELTNKGLCQTGPLTAAVTSKYASDQIVYSIEKLCQNCTSINSTSDPLVLYDRYGVAITKVNFNNLTLRVYEKDLQGGNIGGSCETTSHCNGQGYDCCLAGQCVNDKTLRSGVDLESDEYLQALNDITSNPSHIYNYEEFYYLCQTNVTPTPTPVPTVDPSLLPDARLMGLDDLYHCVNPIYGDMGVCTEIYEGITPQNYPNYLPFETSPYDLAYGQFYFGDPANITLNPMLHHSVFQLIYNGELIYDATQSITYGNVSLGESNFNFLDTTEVDILSGFPGESSDRLLRVRYTTDSSCIEISQNLAKCSKYYVQGQNLGRPTDHYPGSLEFELPYYADLTKMMTVTLDGIVQIQYDQWNVDSSRTVTFTNPVIDNQHVTISYYVNRAVYPVYEAKKKALDKIKEYCDCQGEGCNLYPVVTDLGGYEKITDYRCIYPESKTIEPPLQQSVYVSSKAAPVRYFDEAGKEYTNLDLFTQNQEGKDFEYKNNDPIKPNSATEYVGFNEIYGNISYRVTSASPPVKIDVKAGKSYDLFVDSGSYSSCYNCGTDYYNKLNKLFPDNFIYNGGGYYPDKFSSDPFNASLYRSDDLLWGRACFVPATMIPWSHVASYDRSPQRQARMATQHFLFANGLQRDWYGFDYGALIGSFDGVTWFAVGNQRRVKATSNRMYLAVNAYFSDLTQSNQFKVVISDATIAYGGGSSVSTDYDSDGAQCQRYHLCESDKDCVTQLGWDYSCQNVTTLTTPWPSFDSNASELIGVADRKRLVSLLIGGFKGSSKRCVYRGRGAICHRNHQGQSESSSYAGVSSPGINGCSMNNYCQTMSSGSTTAKFNNSISRFSKSPTYQNASSSLEIEKADTFGKGARAIGRPLEFNGDKTVPDDVRPSILSNRLDGICLPGRDPEQTAFSTQNAVEGIEVYSGDRVLGIGVTSRENQSTTLYSSCSILDSNGNFVHNSTDSNLNQTTDPQVIALGASQALSSNSFSLFEQIDPRIDFYTYFHDRVITTPKIQRHTCLRNAGSICFSDLDCGPSTFVKSKLGNIDPNSTTATNRLNAEEIKFWKEDLVCSQAAQKSEITYDPKNNKCCREVGKELTIPTYDSQSDLFYPMISGVTVGLNQKQRLSRFNILAYERYKEDGFYEENPLSSQRFSTYPHLTQATKDQCAGNRANCYPLYADLWPTANAYTLLKNQYNTFSYTAKNSCCSGHWIRNFHKDNKGGGHTWGSGKIQRFDYKNLQCLNWSSSVASEDDAFCDPAGAPDFVDCQAKNITLSEADKIYDFFGRLELLGIPQITIPDITNNPSVACTSGAGGTIGGAIPKTIKSTGFNQAEYVHPGNDNVYDTADDIPYLSSTDEDNFEGEITPIFDPDSISCCIPTGKDLSDNQSATADMCCSGYMESYRCCLPDYADVSLYMNKYVSTAAKGLNDSMFDPETGYIKDINIVEMVANQENLCCSGTMIRGQILNYLSVKGLEDQNFRVRRFMDGSTPNDPTSADVKNFWNAGVRWNNHLYCFPAPR